MGDIRLTINIDQAVQEQFKELNLNLNLEKNKILTNNIKSIIRDKLNNLTVAYPPNNLTLNVYVE